MTKDRIEQLRAEMSKQTKAFNYKFWVKEENLEEEIEDEKVTLTGVVVHPTVSKAGKKENDALQAIFKEVNQINEWLDEMKESIIVLKTCQILVQQSTRPDPGMRDKIQDVRANIKGVAAKIRGSLQALEQKKEETDSAINKVVDTQHCLLKQTYSEVLDDYQQALILHRKICEDILKKQLVIVIEMVNRRITCVPADVNIPQKELEAILETEDIAVFVDNYMKDMLEAKLVLQDAQTRHKEIIQLEKEIQNVNELFTDLSMHVTRQGELVDRIEYHIASGSEKTQKASIRISKARKIMSKMRKVKCWLIAVVLIILGFLILTLFIT